MIIPHHSAPYCTLLEQPQENAKNILYGGFDLPPYNRCTFRYSSLMVSVTAISRIRLAGA